MNHIDELKQKDALIDKLIIISFVWRRWIELYQKNIKLEEYFIKRGVKKIAIYGMADIGIALYQELMQSSVEVSYGMDINRQICEFDVEIRKPNMVDDKVDMIVVTAVTHFSSVLDELNLYLENKIPIVGIDEVIMELLIGEE